MGRGPEIDPRFQALPGSARLARLRLAVEVGFVGAVLACAALLWATDAFAVPSGPQKCQARKSLEAGRYEFCLQRAEAGLVRTGDAAAHAGDVLDCETRFAERWALAEEPSLVTCFDETARLTRPEFKTVIDQHSANIAGALAGGPLNTCATSRLQCESDRDGCRADLTACLAAELPATRFLGTGQTTCFDTDGVPIACAGTGQDGDLQMGLPRTHTDNSDGTITDEQTLLMWEKKSDDGGPHDQDRTFTFTWANAFAFIGDLNTVPCFAGHCDWRMPQMNELHTLVDYGTYLPITHAAFNQNCGGGAGNPGCTLATCSCTARETYYSSTNSVVDPGYVHAVSFYLGTDSHIGKTGLFRIRAVRGGL